MRASSGEVVHGIDAGASAAARPVLLATLDVPFDEDAAAFAVDAAVEAGRPLLVVNVAQVPLAPWALIGWGYVERDALQDDLRRPAALAQALTVPVERLRVCSPHPVDALLEVADERRPSVLVFGPDRSRLARRAYRRAARKVSVRAGCLVWLADAA